MFEHIRGSVVSKAPTMLVVEASGIGYKFHIPLSTYEKIPSHGEVKVYAFLHVREDEMKLYGFASQEERNHFELLISITGVGPSLALSVLSGISSSRLRQAIINEDPTLLEKIKGIGKKTAARIILELRESIDRIGVSETAQPVEDETGQLRDAVAALMSLGDKRAEAEKAVATAHKTLGTGRPLEELIKEAFRHR